MEIDVDWNEGCGGYLISYSIPEMHLIDSRQAIRTEFDFYQSAAGTTVILELSKLGITREALVNGTGIE
ncbi:MAG: hypothetical protein HFF11_10450 [Angelakisella sp.]|jgi:hypothetical protein|nr:hypothetical protein [Angelakisella sp.]